MSYPHVPVNKTPDWERRAAGAVNHLLSRPSFVHLQVGSASGTIFTTAFPVTLTIVPEQSKLIGTASLVFKVNGTTIGTGSAGSYAFTDTQIPAGATFEITGTANNATISLAVIR